MAAASLPILSGAAAAGVSAIGGAASTRASNQANKEIAQMNNEFNEKMLEKQMAYNKEMYNTQLGDQWKFYNDAKQNSWNLFNASNEYNSASAQRQRLEAAGLNPYLMMSGGSAGTASSTSMPSGSSPSAQGVNPPTATPYSADYSALAQGLGQAADIISSSAKRKVDNATAENLRIEGKYKAAKTMAEIISLRTDAKTKEGRLALDKLIYSIDKDLKSSQMAVNSENIANMQAQRKLINIQTLMANKQLSFMDAQNKMDLAQKAADIQLKYAQGALTRKQVEHEIAKIAETHARTDGQLLQNTSQMYQNAFDVDTYKDRVKTVKESLFNLIYNGTGTPGLLRNMGARFFNSLGVDDGVH